MKMTLLGTGIRTLFILHSLVERQGDLEVEEVVLHDSDTERLDTMARLGGYMCAQWGGRFTVRGERDAAEALRGSRFVFSAIRVGQEPARRLDEEVPLGHGVLGQETTGPGGFAMALRTIPVMLGYARLIEEVAPGALVINFTNPVGLIVQALTEHSSVRVVGICDGPVDMKRSIARFLGVPGDEVHVDYFGLNHLGWIRRVLVDGQDQLPMILDRYEELQESGLGEWRLFDAELVRGLGMLPNEYLYFYYNRDLAMQHILASGGTRGGQLADLNLPLWRALRDRVAAEDFEGALSAWQRARETRSRTYFARERGDALEAQGHSLQEPPLFEGTGYEGMAAAVMQASLQLGHVPLILNVPNRGAIPELHDEDVVEVTCLTDRHGAFPLSQGSTPDAALALLQPVKAYERLTVEAAVTGSYDAAVQALTIHPLVGSFGLAKKIVNEYRSAHAKFLQYLAS